MESLIADFTQFSKALANLLFLQKRLVTRLCVHVIMIFPKNLFIS